MGKRIIRRFIKNKIREGEGGLPLPLPLLFPFLPPSF